MNTESGDEKEADQEKKVLDGQTVPEPVPAQARTDREALLEQWLGPAPKLSVAKVIIAINLIVFGAMCILSGFASLMNPSVDLLLNWGGDFGPYTLNGQYWRILSSIFVHAGLIHIAFNMVVLNDIARTVERLFGSTKFLLLYFISGIGGSLLSLLFSPGIVSVGASGAVFGVYGGLLAFFLLHRSKIPQETFVASSKTIFAFILYNLLFGFASAHTDNAAHIGGLLFGFAEGLVLLNATEFRSWRLKNIFGTFAVFAAFYGLFVVAQSAPFDKEGSVTLVKAAQYLDDKKYKQAMDLLNPYIELHPDNALAFENRAHVYLSNNDLDKALADAKKAIKLNPKNSRALCIRAQIHEKNGQSKEALADENAALVLEPDSPQIRTQRMLTYLRLNQHANSLADNDWLLKHGGDSTPLKLIRASLLNETGKLKEALELSDALSHGDSQFAKDAVLIKVSVLRKLNEREKARTVLEEFIKNNPGKSDFAGALAWLEFYDGNMKQSIKYSNEAISHDNKSARLYRERGIMHFVNAEPELARSDFEKYFQLAEIGDEQKNYAIIFSTLVSEQLHDSGSRKQLLSTALDQKNKEWPYQVLQYLNGEWSAEQLETLANNNDKMTEAKTYIALQLIVQGKLKNALPYLDWVRKNGNKEFIEYELAKILLSGKTPLLH